jgi:hypothetical protein
MMRRVFAIMKKAAWIARPDGGKRNVSTPYGGMIRVRF